MKSAARSCESPDAPQRPADESCLHKAAELSPRCAGPLPSWSGWWSKTKVEHSVWRAEGHDPPLMSMSPNLSKQAPAYGDGGLRKRCRSIIKWIEFGAIHPKPRAPDKGMSPLLCRITSESTKGNSG
jgi:hypothetical protein